jgi:uracil DNA glycosylase
MNPLNQIHPNWGTLFEKNRTKLKLQLKSLDHSTLTPRIGDIFKCYSVDPTTINACIIDQGPHISRKHATGYALEVPTGLTRQEFYIFQLTASKYGINIDSLDPIRETVMLLNADLTSKAGEQWAHDWRWFTTLTLEYIKKVNPTCQFIFLGGYAGTLNTFDGLKFAHPTANARSMRELFNTSFFEKTEESVQWTKIYGI